MAKEIIAAAPAEESAEAVVLRDIAFEANYQIEKLASVLKEHHMKASTDDWPIYHGILGRIQQLSEVVFYAAGLGGPRDEVGGPSIETLRQFLDGHFGIIVKDEVQHG